jgi:hypothetical protein
LTGLTIDLLTNAIKGDGSRVHSRELLGDDEKPYWRSVCDPVRNMGRPFEGGRNAF